MGADKLESLVEGLREEEKKLQEELTGLEQRMADTRGKLKRVQAGLRALGSESAPKTEGKGVSRADVLRLLEGELGGGKPVPEGELKQRIQTRAAAEGRSLKGLHLRMAEALKDKRFTSSAEGYRLKG